VIWKALNMMKWPRYLMSPLEHGRKLVETPILLLLDADVEIKAGSGVRVKK